MCVCVAGAAGKRWVEYGRHRGVTCATDYQYTQDKSQVIITRNYVPLEAIPILIALALDPLVMEQERLLDHPDSLK